MSIPSYLSVVEDVRRRYPAEWAAAHRGGPDTEAFIRRLAWELHQRDPSVGLNGKRGNPGDLSDDCICYKGQGGQSLDVRTGQRVAVIDVIAGAGGPNPQPAWGEVWDPANIPTAATWVQPTPVGGEVPGPRPTPTPPPPTPTPGCDLAPVLERLRAHEAMLVGLVDAVRQIGERLDTLAVEQETQQAEIVAGVEAARQARNLAQNISDRMEAGLPIVEGRAGWAGALSGKVRG